MKLKLASIILFLTIFTSCKKETVKFIEIQNLENVVLQKNEIATSEEVHQFVDKIFKNPYELRDLFDEKYFDQLVYLKHHELTSDSISRKAISYKFYSFFAPLQRLANSIKDHPEKVVLSNIISDTQGHNLYFLIDTRKTDLKNDKIPIVPIVLKIYKANNQIKIYDFMDFRKGFSQSDIAAYFFVNDNSSNIETSQSFKEMKSLGMSRHFIQSNCQLDIIRGNSFWKAGSSPYYEEENKIIDEKYFDSYPILARQMQHLDWFKEKDDRNRILRDFIKAYGELSPVSSFHKILLDKSKGNPIPDEDKLALEDIFDKNEMLDECLFQEKS